LAWEDEEEGVEEDVEEEEDSELKAFCRFIDGELTF
jgi:hypothetical protein